MVLSYRKTILTFAKQNNPFINSDRLFVLFKCFFLPIVLYYYVTCIILRSYYELIDLKDYSKKPIKCNYFENYTIR